MQLIEFKLSAQPDLTKIDSLILPVFAEGKTTDENFGLAKILQELNEAGDFSGKAGQVMTLIAPTSDFKRVFLVGFGEAEKITQKSYIAAITAAAAAINKTGAVAVLDATTSAKPSNQTDNWAVYQNALILQNSLYEYNHPSRGKDHKAKEFKLNQIWLQAAETTENQAAMAQATATAKGMSLAKDVANMPANFCTPAHLAETAIELGKQAGFEVKVLEREEMIAMGMGSFMSVAQGTPTPPKMISISYQGGAKDQAPICLVGKGVTFDTGGISLKPGASMDEMKYDMGGAASVLGVFKALAELKPAINVVGVIPSTENMPSGKAVKPGDVVTSLSGQTIEILNTDAEGRLILCDALTYAQQTFKPDLVVDIATLTGACIIALGGKVSGLMGNDQDLVDAVHAAGNFTYDCNWQLPLAEEYDEQLKSNFADMANIGGREAGTITAAQFLARFTKDVKWAHLDVAGTAWQSGANKGATGRPVPSLVQLILSQIK